MNFIVFMHRCDGNCDTVKDLFDQICVPNKMEEVNLKLFSMIKGVSESKTLAKHITCEYRCEFDDRKCNSRQKRNNEKCECECKKSIKHCTYEEDYAWNPSTSAYRCDKDCDISEMHEKSC